MGLLMFALPHLPCIPLLLLRECFDLRLSRSLARTWHLFPCPCGSSCIGFPLTLSLGLSGWGREFHWDIGRQVVRGKSVSLLWRLNCRAL